jgi:hypothetical protein
VVSATEYDKLLRERDELRAALREVMLTGTDCAPADDPASFYRSQLHSCIGTAARAIGEEAT